MIGDVEMMWERVKDRSQMQSQISVTWVIEFEWDVRAGERGAGGGVV